MKFEIANLAMAAVAAVGVAMGAMSARAADKDIVDTAVARRSVQHAGRGAHRGRAGRDPEGRRAVHGLRAHR